jgi:hypothetical protein
VRPASFDGELQEDWSRWVLAHGLPELPGPDLAVGQAVPVSYWIGPDTAAVLHIRRIHSETFEEPETETDVQCFYLEGGVWMPSGSGGTGWREQSPLARVTVPPDHVKLDGVNGGRVGLRGCKALWGEVGTGAAIAEVIQAGQVTRRPVQAPIGLQVVCGYYGQPFTVRVLNAEGQLLAQIEEQAGFDEGPWP